MTKTIDLHAGALVLPKRPWRERLRSMALLGLVAITFMALDDWHDRHAILINASESLPTWALLVETGRFPARGDYVVFDPGHAPLVVKHFGEHPRPFAKIAYGLPGDVVTRDGARVIVNGVEVSRLKPFTRQGESLVPGPTGRVPAGCVYAGTPHKDGFDSRYAAIGFICHDRLIGTGEPIL
ncbi:S26 family signal peptidase [Novosphingobium sp. Fuku2-ISO-50]|uniref:S26 family signal peptidase n=1 Tax=Novosphingobium sp. Fuku2-ISO-50 TaxID=1739114 RepID=UPI00076D96F7|nr:type VI secretion protein [Novosphingobium sp. Fuku2-ISO-50]